MNEKERQKMKQKMKKMNNVFGFTLIEMMLVIVVVSILIWASVGYIQQRTLQMRMDRTSLQMQQILNAGLAYYVTNGKWPSSLNDLKGTYLPNIVYKNPWNQDYRVTQVSLASNALPMLVVYTGITQSGANTGSALASANTIAGTLPLSYTSSDAGSPPDSTVPCDESSDTCYVVASVNIPGQELSNARGVNFAGIYNHGACVPVPQCPVDPANNTPMKPQVMIVPISVSGRNISNSTDVFPISSFGAYAMGNDPLDVSPPRCKDTTSIPLQNCAILQNVGPAAPAYWRACIKITTERGYLPDTRTNDDRWGDEVKLMAITRCAPPNEPSGSNFLMYTD
jgi:prepilin-type N-terminal cleavage/methylation domain-containing protein